MNTKCTYCGFRQDIPHHGVIECVNCGMRFPSSPKYESAVIRNRRNLRWDSIDGISVDEMERYGYIWDKMVPVSPDTAHVQAAHSLPCSPLVTRVYRTPPPAPHPWDGRVSAWDRPRRPAPGVGPRSSALPSALPVWAFPASAEH